MTRRLTQREQDELASGAAAWARDPEVVKL